MRKIDITNQKFGSLTVMFEVSERHNNKVFWHCKCDCGNEIDVESFKLRTGHTKSCGCLKTASLGRKDFAGRRFGRLVVQEMVYEKYGATRCKCRCDCGNNILVSSTSLLRNVTRSCGCLRSESNIARCSKNLVGKKYGHLLTVERVKETGESTRYKCICDCGAEIVVDGRALVSGATQSCGCAHSSHGETYIASVLDGLNIEYIRQYRFKDCAYKRSLPFDFYIPKNHICIEYQGRQHYESIQYFDRTDDLDSRQNRDNIKRNYCKTHQISLLEIPYYFSKDKIIQILTNKLNP